MDPKMPGALDCILNLGDYWDEEKLRSHREALLKFSKVKAELYQKTYRYFAAARLFMKGADLESTIQTRKAADEYIDALKLTLYGEKKGYSRKLFASGVTPVGHVDYLDSILEGHVVGLIGDGQPSVFLHTLAEAATLAGYDTDVFYCPFSPEDKMEHLVIPALGISFTTLNDYHYFERCDDILFLEPEEGSDEELLVDSLLQSAIDTLAEAKEWHMKIEEIYVPAMDFKKLSPVYDAILEKLL